MSNKQESRYGQSGQNVTPGWSSTSTRSDGKESTVYGNKGQSSPHGHSVRDSGGKVEYSRTIGGTPSKTNRLPPKSQIRAVSKTALIA